MERIWFEEIVKERRKLVWKEFDWMGKDWIGMGQIGKNWIEKDWIGKEFCGNVLPKSVQNLHQASEYINSKVRWPKLREM